MKTYDYTIGPNQREASESKTKGNGCWHTQAASMKEALRIIFGSMTYPGEASGRERWNGSGFVEGVSIPGKHDGEIIQVWSNEPAAVERVPYKDRRRHWHDNKPDPSEEFLLCEIEVTKLDEYLTPITALLAGPKNENVCEALSPMGVSVVQFEQQKQELQKAIQFSKFEIQQRKWTLQEIEEAMEEKIDLINQQIRVVNAYIHGTRCRTQIHTGRQSTGPYYVFQTRQFLNQELGLLANFHDFDFQDLVGLEKWLVRTGHVWKLLPHERCILVTRVRDTEKEYGNVWENMFKNEMNMQNMIWVRDGENVYHVDVEFKFDNAVFPDKDQFDRVHRTVLEHVWNSRFNPSYDRWGHSSFGRQVDPPQGQIKPAEHNEMDKKTYEPENERSPYTEVRIVNKRFKTVDEWLDSDSYTPELDTQLRRACQDYLREKNKKQMIFCVLLQGIVDNTELLQIPKGTDLFNWENVAKYFVLVSDYTHGICDHTQTDKFEEYLDISKVRVGDWVIAWLDENTYRYDREGRPWLFKVTGMADVAKPEQGEVTHKSGHLTISAKTHDESGHWPVVMYRPKAKHYRHGATDDRVKALQRLVLNPKHRRREKEIGVGRVLRVPFSPGLAEKIIDDREWKMQHRDLVPIVAQYRKVVTKFLGNPVNQTEIVLKETSEL
jgi:hypothetical protein